MSKTFYEDEETRVLHAFDFEYGISVKIVELDSPNVKPVSVLSNIGNTIMCSDVFVKYGDGEKFGLDAKISYRKYIDEANNTLSYLVYIDGAYQKVDIDLFGMSQDCAGFDVETIKGSHIIYADMNLNYDFIGKIKQLLMSYGCDMKVVIDCAENNGYREEAEESDKYIDPTIETIKTNKTLLSRFKPTTLDIGENKPIDYDKEFIKRKKGLTIYRNKSYICKVVYYLDIQELFTYDKNDNLCDITKSRYLFKDRYSKKIKFEDLPFEFDTSNCSKKDIYRVLELTLTGRQIEEMHITYFVNFTAQSVQKQHLFLREADAYPEVLDSVSGSGELKLEKIGVYEEV